MAHPSPEATTGPSTPKAETKGFRILSYNIWAFFLAANVEDRIRAFATEAHMGRYDLVLLQEVFDRPMYDLIVELMGSTFAFSSRFSTSHFGNGLAVFSRYPIMDTHFVQFYVQGDAEKFHHGDYYCNKGVSLTRLRIPRSAFFASQSALRRETSSDAPPSPDHHHARRHPIVSAAQIAEGEEYFDVNVYNTHTVACREAYSRVGFEGETNSGTRMSQLGQVARFIEITSGPKDHIIVGGDMNVGGAYAPELLLLRSHFAAYYSHYCKENSIKLRSIFQHAPPRKDRPFQEDSSEHITFTEENPNTISEGMLAFWMSFFDEDLPAQLDHLFVASPALKIIQSRVAFKEALVKGKPLSDHYALEATLALEQEGEELVDVGEQNPETSEADLRFGIDFLRQRAERCSRQREHFQNAVGAFLVCVPLCLSLSMKWKYAASGVAVSGFVAGICFIVGRMQRGNDRVTLAQQAEDLQMVLDFPPRT